MSTLTDFEIACGHLTGRSATSTPCPTDAGPSFSPLAALEAAILPAVRRSPCVVSFSGGKDSALILAVATRVARREGLDLPIPVSWRFPDSQPADETGWQESILAELEIAENATLLGGDNLDLVGPLARSVLLGHGVLYPPNLHLHLPILDMARGGALLTGLGGDQMLTCFAGVGVPVGRSMARASLSRLPARLRRPVLAAVRTASGHSGDDQFPWLQPAAARTGQLQMLDDGNGRPRSPRRRLSWERNRRRLTVTAGNLEMLATEREVEVVNPLLSRRFHDSLLAAFAGGGRLDRSALIAEISGGKLPAVIHQQRPKASFAGVFVRDPARTLAAEWDGTGINDALVDPAELRRLWRAGSIPIGTALLLQTLWIQQNARVGLRHSS